MMNDYTSKVKARAYDVKVVAFQIEYSNPEVNFRENKEYQDAKDSYIDMTMSCDRDEAKDWMKYFMSNSIAYGICTKNLDWRPKFLAAFDLFNSFH